MDTSFKLQGEICVSWCNEVSFIDMLTCHGTLLDIILALSSLGGYALFGPLIPCWHLLFWPSSPLAALIVLALWSLGGTYCFGPLIPCWHLLFGPMIPWWHLLFWPPSPLVSLIVFALWSLGDTYCFGPLVPWWHLLFWPSSPLVALIVLALWSLVGTYCFGPLVPWWHLLFWPSGPLAGVGHDPRQEIRISTVLPEWCMISRNLHSYYTLIREADISLNVNYRQ